MVDAPTGQLISLVCSKQPDDHAVGDASDTETRILRWEMSEPWLGGCLLLMGAVEKSGRATQLSPVGMPASTNFIFAFFSHLQICEF